MAAVFKLHGNAAGPRDTSPAVWDHTVLPATWYRQTRPCFIYGRRARPLHVTVVTFPAVKPLPIYCLVDRGMCVNNLP